MQRAFISKAGKATKRLAVGTTTSSIKLGTAAPNDVIRVYNAGSQIAYLEFGDSTTTAVVPVAGTGTGGTAGSMPFGSGITEVQATGFAGADVYMSGITSTSTADVYATLGDGI